MQMRSTIKEVAEFAGVTPAIVSRIMNADETLVVRKETRRRVLEAIKKFNYRPNAVARSLKLKRTNTMAMFIPSLTSMNHLNIIQGAQMAGEELGYAILLCTTGDIKENEQKYLSLMLEKQVDGLILASVHSDDKIIEMMNNAQIPYILINRDSSDPESLFVGSDDFVGGKMATDYLIEKGHRKIGHIAGLLFTNTAIGRLSGYKEALRNANINLSSDYIVESAYNEADASIAAKKLLSLAEPPTAIFAASDEIAFGAIEAIKESGLKVGKDVSVMGFGDIWMSEKITPALTTIHVSLFEMGYEAVNKLAKRIKKQKVNCCKTMLPLKLVERQTVEACKT